MTMSPPFSARSISSGSRFLASATLCLPIREIGNGNAAGNRPARSIAVSRRESEEMDVDAIRSVQHHGMGERIDGVAAGVHARVSKRERVLIPRLQRHSLREPERGTNPDKIPVGIRESDGAILIGDWRLIPGYATHQGPILVEAIDAADRDQPTVPVLLLID